MPTTLFMHGAAPYGDLQRAGIIIRKFNDGLAPSGFCTPVRILTAPPPTGRTLTLPGASFTRVEGDKIRYERVYTDRQTVTEQLGFTPKKT
jgi:hypothetical protein